MPCHPCFSCLPKKEERKKNTATAKEESAPLIAYKKTEAVKQGHKAVVDASADADQPPNSVQPRTEPEEEAAGANVMPGSAAPEAEVAEPKEEVACGTQFDGNENAALEQQIVPFTAAESGIDGSAAPSTESEQEDACTRTLRNLFQELDLDGNGKISPIEMIKVVRKKPDIAKCIGLPQTVRQEDGTRDMIEQWFQAIDVDDNSSSTGKSSKATSILNSLSSIQSSIRCLLAMLFHGLRPKRRLPMRKSCQGPLPQRSIHSLSTSTRPRQSDDRSETLDLAESSADSFLFLCPRRLPIQ